MVKPWSWLPAFTSYTNHLSFVVIKYNNKHRRRSLFRLHSRGIRVHLGREAGQQHSMEAIVGKWEYISSVISMMQRGQTGRKVRLWTLKSTPSDAPSSSKVVPAKPSPTGTKCLNETVGDISPSNHYTVWFSAILPSPKTCLYNLKWLTVLCSTRSAVTNCPSLVPLNIPPAHVQASPD